MRNNLKKIRLTIGYNQQQMAERLEMPLRTYMGYEYKAKVYPLDFIHKLSDILNINIHFLYTGEGEMFVSKNNNTLTKRDNTEKLTDCEAFHKHFNKHSQASNLNDFDASKPLYSTRLKQLKKTLNLTTEQLANAIDMPSRTFGSYERGESKIPLELLTKLCNQYSINPEWFALGEGEMFISKTENTLIKTVNNNILTGQDTFHKRFNKLQQTNNINDFEMSKILDIPESRIEKLGIGKSMPTLDELNSIKLNFDVSIDWLLYGETPYKSTQSEELTLSAEEINQLKLLAKKFNT